jgi:hypothetical protein
MISWKYNELLCRTLFVFGNLALCVAVGSATVMSIRALFADRDSRIIDQQRILAQLTAIAAQEETVKSVESNTEAQMQRSEFLVGPNESVINADLQTRLKGIASSVGARLRVVQGLPARTDDKTRYTGSRIEIYGPLQSIYRGIFAVESATPYLFITAAAIKAMPSDGRPGTSTEPIIQAQLDIFGAIEIKGRNP